ncbi:alanine:cation symporter family protein [Bacillus sp. SL00103]
MSLNSWCHQYDCETRFGFEQFAGGTLGGALLQGIKRGLFSNEAGMGSAPNASKEQL